MKDILIVVSPSQENTDASYIALQKAAEQYGTEATRILYTSFVLTGPRSFEICMSLLRIADQHGLDAGVFELEAVLQHPKPADRDTIPRRPSL